MARLAEYLQQLAAIFGEVKSVHFARVEKACLKVVANLDPGVPAQRVQSRIYAVRDKNAPSEAMRAADRINEMVAEDRGVARITYGAAVILRFPGRVSAIDKPLSIVDHATITGRLYALSEDPSGGIRARIRPRGVSGYISCTADRDIGGDLRNFFADNVRVHGRGTWQRSTGGEWSCLSLHIEDARPVKDVTLREAVNSLREIQADWGDDPLAEWAQLDERNGAA